MSKCANPTCQEVGKSKCSACLFVSYCGSSCQKVHWTEHKAACKAARSHRINIITDFPKHMTLASTKEKYDGALYIVSLQNLAPGAKTPTGQYLLSKNLVSVHSASGYIDDVFLYDEKFQNRIVGRVRLHRDVLMMLFEPDVVRLLEEKKLITTSAFLITGGDVLRPQRVTGLLHQMMGPV